MGAEQSKISQEKLTEITTDAILKNSQSCTQNASQSFNLSAKDIGGDFTLKGLDVTQVIDINLTCLQDSIQQASVQKDIKEDLKLEVDSATPFWNKVPYQEIYNKNIAKLASKIDIESIKTCLSVSAAETSIEIENVDGNVLLQNITVFQLTEIVAECVQNDTQVMDELAKLNRKMSTEAKSHELSLKNGLIIAGVFLLLIVVFKIRRSFKKLKLKLKSEE